MYSKTVAGTMSQQQQQQQQQQQAEGSVAAAPSFVARAANMVAANAYISLAAIVVLTVIIIGAYIYYNGFLSFGPYAKGKSRSSGKTDEASDKGDPETERLIAAINNN